MKRTEIRDEMKHHENLKINAKENNSREKEARGTYVQHNANLKRWRNQKCKLLEEKELLGKCDGLATAHTHTFKQDCELMTHTHTNKHTFYFFGYPPGAQQNGQDAMLEKVPSRVLCRIWWQKMLMLRRQEHRVTFYIAMVRTSKSP